MVLTQVTDFTLFFYIYEGRNNKKDKLHIYYS
jgi:hypothetical protein